jgi:NADPH:quinone reductase-like Zn-dependent oxidoreductase
MQAITASHRDAGLAGLRLTEQPRPHAADNDVVVQVHAAGFTRGELDWPGTWVDRAGHDRAPSIPGHELSGVVVERGYGTTGLTIGQRVFGLSDWTRNGALAEYVAVEARNLAPLPADIDHTVAAALPISGLTAWQGLFVHGRLQPGQNVLILGAAGGVGSIATQLAAEAGARVIGAGRTADRDTVLDLGADRFIDLQEDRLEEIGEVDLVFDVVAGSIRDRSTALVRQGGTLVTIVDPPTTRPTNGQAIFFVVEADRDQLTELARRTRAGRLRPIIGTTTHRGTRCPQPRPPRQRQDHHSGNRTISLTQPGRTPTCSHSTRRGARAVLTSQRPSSGLAARRPATPLRTAAAAWLPGLRRACSSKHAMNCAARSSRG